MYVISGASGRIGSVVADRLLDSGHPVRAVVRRPEAAADWTSRGAEAAVLDLRDSPSICPCRTWSSTPQKWRIPFPTRSRTLAFAIL